MNPQILHRLILTLPALLSAAALSSCVSGTQADASTSSTAASTAIASAASRRLPAGTPLASQYLTWSDGKKIPCMYHTIGSIKVIAVAMAPPNPAADQSRNADDRAAERALRAIAKKGEFLPGIYHGGPISYTTGNGLKTFTP